MDDLLQHFLVEGRELVQAASDDLLALERMPGDRARLDGAFRAVHTLKGGAALFADLAPMSRVLHAAEDLLADLRAGRRGAAAREIDAVLACIGACDHWLDGIAATGALPADAARASAGLVGVLAGAPMVDPPGDTPQAPSWMGPLLAECRGALDHTHAAGRSVTALRYAPRPDCFFLGDDPLALMAAVPDLLGLSLSTAGGAPTDDPFTCRVAIAALTSAPPAAALAPFRFVADQVEAVPVPPPATPMLPPGAAIPGAARSFRIDAAQVDALLALSGELVVAVSGLDGAVGTDRAGLDRLAASIHGAALRLRMVPLSATFRRLPRVVRDAAARLGRDVDFTVRGEAVELDRALVDGLHEPLLHALRNAVDHGIEAPAIRAAAGKPPRGRILLDAWQDAEGVIVDVSDDGAGIDPARIRRAAVARGLLDPEGAAALDDAAALDIVFAPGFSTAAGVTDISGRGVGLDAVRAGVTALGGRVALSSAPGRGTALRIVLPRSGALAAVLTVEVAGALHGVPADAVLEVLRLPRGRVLPTGSGRAFVLRDRTVPLLDASRLLGSTRRNDASGDLRVLVAEVDGAPVGFEIDAVGRRHDILLQPPSGLLAAVPGLLGTALLGDGGVLMVLDLADLAG